MMFPMLDRSPNRAWVEIIVGYMFLMLFLIIVLENMLMNIFRTLRTHWKVKGTYGNFGNP